MNTIFTIDTARSLVDSTEQFPVDFNNAWQWLEFSRKDVAKRSFEKCGFTEGLDFTSFRQKVEREIGATTKEVIQLTVDCFKCWAMMSNTAKGKEVRQYFLECEKIAKENYKPMTPAELFIYSAYKLKELEDKQAELEKNQSVMNTKMSLEAQRTDHIEQLVVQHDAELDRIFNANGHYYSIMGYCNLLGRAVSISEAAVLGRKASRKCRELGFAVVPVKDPRFGAVNTYPEEILAEVI